MKAHAALIVAAVLLGLLALAAWVVSLLVPFVFGVAFGFWKAVGLLILARIVLPSGGRVITTKARG